MGRFDHLGKKVVMALRSYKQHRWHAFIDSARAYTPMSKTYLMVQYLDSLLVHGAPAKCTTNP